MDTSANAARQYILSVCVSVCNNAIHALCQNVVISCSYAWHKNSGFSIDILIRLENSTISWRHTHSLVNEECGLLRLHAKLIKMIGS